MLRNQIITRAAIFLALLFGVWTLSAGQAIAQAKIGVGARSCSEFSADYSNSTEIAELAYISWMQGYLTGVNIFLTASSEDALDLHPGKKDSDWFFSYVREFCADNPLRDFSDGVIQLFYEEILKAQ